MGKAGVFIAERSAQIRPFAPLTAIGPTDNVTPLSGVFRAHIMAEIFVVSAIVSVVGAVLMVARRNPIYGLIFLLVSFSGAAGVFYSLNATFIAVSQILVYAGAIAVLFLFVLMFIDLGKKGEDKFPARVDSLSTYEPAAVEEGKISEGPRFQFSYPAAVVAMTVFALFVWVAASLPEETFDKFDPVPIHGPAGPIREDETNSKSSPIYFGSTAAVGRAIFERKGPFESFALHYEVVGLVILVGVMGAVILGKRIGDEQREEQERKLKAAVAGADGHDDHGHDHGHGHH